VSTIPTVRERSQRIDGSNGAERDIVHDIMRKQGIRRLTNALGNYFPFRNSIYAAYQKLQNSKTVALRPCRSVDMDQSMQPTGLAAR